MDEKQFKAITQKLDAIITLLAMDKLTDKPKKDTILMLSQCGLDYATIASIADTTIRSVTVVISDAKKVNRNSLKGKNGKVDKHIAEPEEG